MKDLLFTNRFQQDVTNMNFIEYPTRTSQFGIKKANNKLFKKTMEDLPDVKLSNYLFKNNRGLTFEDKSMDWGLDHHLQKKS